MKGDTHYTLRMVKKIFKDSGFLFKYFTINQSAKENNKEYIYLVKNL